MRLNKYETQLLQKIKKSDCNDTVVVEGLKSDITKLAKRQGETFKVLGYKFTYLNEVLLFETRKKPMTFTERKFMFN